MSKYYVTGGTQRKNAQSHIEWFNYGEASIYLFDDADGSVTKCASYVTPNDIRPDDENANVVFKAGSLDGDRLVVCTQTEILTYSLPDFKQVGYATHPWLNDAHHVAINRNGNYLVANTGLDMVLELTPEGEVVRDLSALPGKNIWDRFDRNVDYRKVITTKPHHSHPNYVVEIDGELWVSRFIQKDMICLTNPEKRIEAGIEKVHDGNIHNGKIYSSTVNGHIIIADPATCRVLATHDLNAITDTNKALGWCRGLHVLDDERIIVGFSRIRPSKFRENVQWAKFKMGKRESAGRLPTRVVLYDLAKGNIEWNINLEEHTLNAVFSILPAD